MALSRTLIIIILVAFSTIFSTIAVEEYIVGDDYGWRTLFDYQAWAADKNFYVGDRIVFKYVPGWDNVVRVNPDEFITCSVSPNAITLSSGEDEIIFGGTGARWYISSIGNHCKLGQKLAIYVWPAWSPPLPSPAPWTQPPYAPWTPITPSADPPYTPPAPWTPITPSIVTPPAPLTPIMPPSEPPYAPSAPWTPITPSVEPPYAPSIATPPAPWTPITPSAEPPYAPWTPITPSTESPYAPQIIPTPIAQAPRTPGTPSSSIPLAPAPSSKLRYASWTTSFSHFARSMPKKPFKISH